MEIFLIILMAFAVLGFVDKAIGGRLGFEREIDTGLSTMGTVAVYIVGIYCIGIVLIEGNGEAIGRFTSFFPMDPSILIGSLIAPDLGGQPIAMGLAENKNMGFYSGIIVGACLGQFISFQLPVIFAVLDGETKQKMAKGFIYGIIAVPAGLFAGGLVMGLSPGSLLLNNSVIAAICLILLLGFLRAAKRTEKIILAFSGAVRFVCQILFAVVAAGLFIPSIAVVPREIILGALLIVLRMTVIVCGGLVLTKIIINLAGKFFDVLGGKMGTDKLGVIGLLLNMINSLTALALFSKMDDRGKIINGAFCVSGAYILGGQMAFVLAVAPTFVFWGYIASKAVAGVTAVAIALFVESRHEKNPQAMVNH